MNDNIRVIIDGNTIKSPDNLLSKRLSYAEIAILLTLIEAKGEIVNRDTLMAKGWPGKVVVPNSLNMAILALRRALGAFGLSDNIVTIPRGGFRLDQHYLFGHIKKAEYHDDGEIVERDFSSIILEAGGDYSSVNNKKHHQLTPVDFSCDVENIDKIRFSLLDVALVTLLIFNVFVFIHLSLNRPELVCSELKDKVIVCAIELNEDVMNAALEYLQVSELNNQGLLWAELNPHESNGYKFYIVE